VASTQEQLAVFARDAARCGPAAVEHFAVGRWSVAAPGAVRFEVHEVRWGWTVGTELSLPPRRRIVTREGELLVGVVAPLPTWLEAGRAAPGPVAVVGGAASGAVRLGALVPTGRTAFLPEELADALDHIRATSS